MAEVQKPGLRTPRQERARYKVELILEATVRLLERDGLEGLTTNAAAAAAGVSIGTLYQYFANKEALLDALAERETAAMAERVKAVMRDPGLVTPEMRIAAVVAAVAASYGQRRRAHRLVMAHSLSRGGGTLAPLLAEMIAHLSRNRESGAIRQALPSADAFVLAHGFAGVLRAMTSEQDEAPPQAEIATALAQLVTRFLCH